MSDMLEHAARTRQAERRLLLTSLPEPLLVLLIVLGVMMAIIGINRLIRGRGVPRCRYSPARPVTRRPVRCGRPQRDGDFVSGGCISTD